MDNDRKREIATQGGCGLIARAVLNLRPDGTPVLWYDRDGSAIHAAIKFGRQLVHLGSRETGYTETSADELNRAIAEDFYPDRLNLQEGEIEKLAAEIIEDF